MPAEMTEAVAQLLQASAAGLALGAFAGVLLTLGK